MYRVGDNRTQPGPFGGQANDVSARPTTRTKNSSQSSAERTSPVAGVAESVPAHGVPLPPEVTGVSHERQPGTWQGEAGATGSFLIKQTPCRDGGYLIRQRRPRADHAGSRPRCSTYREYHAGP